MARFWAWIREFFGYPPALMSMEDDDEESAEDEFDDDEEMCMPHRVWPGDSWPSVDEVYRKAAELNRKPWCHDNKCPGRAKHDCHDLDCRHNGGKR